MDDSEQSPFGEWRGPRRGAAEEWLQRRYQQRYLARANRRRLLRAALCFIAGSAGGAAGGVVLEVGLDRLPSALLGAVLGGVLGVGVGALIGCSSFSVMAAPIRRKRTSFGTELEYHDPTPVLNVLLIAWSLIGLTVGSAWGGADGAFWGEQLTGEDSTFRSGFFGSLVGAALLALVWLVWEVRRKARIKTRFLQGMTAAQRDTFADEAGDERYF